MWLGADGNKGKADMMDGSQIDQPGEGSRRHFLRAAAATGSAAAVAAGGSAWADPPAPAAAATPVPTVTLGKTGQKVTILGMGTSWVFQDSFVRAALYSGVRYIDTSENYEGGNCERIVGHVLEQTKMRKDVYLVTKNGRRKIGGPGAYKAYEARLNASLERLRTDYVDCYYLHGLGGGEIALLRDPDVKAAFEKLKKSGKIRFCGLSCHDAMLPEILSTAAEVGWIDQVMFKFNFRDIGGQNRSDELNRAIDKASKANLALVAMKTQGGAINFPDKMAELAAKGFKKEVAAVKTVWLDHRMHVAVSEMTNRDDLRENIAGSQNIALTARELELLEQYRLATAHLYCHGCSQHCEPVAGGVAVAEILRFLKYHEVYGKRQRARELYQALPPEARNLAAADLAAAQAACPHGLPVVELIQRSSQKLG
jgi:predicted aldo/keto reductase-like oxidoreductase